MLKLNKTTIDNHLPLTLIAGPCIIENYATTRTIAAALVDTCRKLSINFIFKASYDKANRTSVNSFRGLGVSRGLSVLRRIKKEFNMPIMTDIHSAREAAGAALVCDIIQIPAFLCRQTDILIAAARTKAVVNIKKGQFAAPGEMKYAIEKVRSAGNDRVMVTERGHTFGYHNLIVDMRSLEILKSMHIPVIYDATHSVQLPGKAGSVSGGQRQFIVPLAKAAVAVGIAGIFFETHPDPHKALSDGPNAVPLKDMAAVVDALMDIDAVVKRR